MIWLCIITTQWRKKQNRRLRRAWGQRQRNTNRTRQRCPKIISKQEVKLEEGSSEAKTGWGWGLETGAADHSVVFPLPLFFSWLWQSLFPVLHSPLSLYLASSLSCILPTWETRGSLKHTKISILSFLPNRQHVPPHRLSLICCYSNCLRLSASGELWHCPTYFSHQPYGHIGLLFLYRWTSHCSFLDTFKYIRTYSV